MKTNKVKYIVISITIIILISLISFDFYKETYGYPWKREEIEKEAVSYMNKKYNMNAIVKESSYNFKFDYYTAIVYDNNDKDKSLISVEKQRFYDKNNQFEGERLEDNYSKVYFEKQLKYDIQEKYSRLYNLNDIEKISVDIAYVTTPLEEGVSSIKDKNGVYIPLKPKLNPILIIDLNTNNLSENFLKELLFLIKDFSSTQMQVDLLVTGKEDVNTGNNTTKTTLIDIQYDKFKDIQSVKDIKNVIRDF